MRVCHASPTMFEVLVRSRFRKLYLRQCQQDIGVVAVAETSTLLLHLCKSRNQHRQVAATVNRPSDFYLSSVILPEIPAAAIVLTHSCDSLEGLHMIQKVQFSSEDGSTVMADVVIQVGNDRNWILFSFRCPCPKPVDRTLFLVVAGRWIVFGTQNPSDVLIHF